MGASPRPPSGEDTSRRRRADTDDETSIFATLVGGEPPASHVWRSVDARGVDLAPAIRPHVEGFDGDTGEKQTATSSRPPLKTA